MSKEKLLVYAPPEEQTDVRFVKGVGDRWADVLANSKFRITSVQGLLQHFPRRHLDFTDTKSISEVNVGDEVTVIAEVRKVVPPPPVRGKRFPLKVIITDDQKAQLELAFFNQPWRAKQLSVGTLIAAKGKITKFANKRQMTSPMVDVIKEAGEAVRIVPIYNATAEIHTAWLRRAIREALKSFTPLEDPLPAAMREQLGLMDRTSAFSNYHFPPEMDWKWAARKRLVFDELFTLQVGLAFKKHRTRAASIGIAHKVEEKLAGSFVESLPFVLTDSQKKAINEIEEDLASEVPMHRLLQGDVGSGKTVVALYSMLVAVQGGFQAAIMAPTEVLATQHYLTISNLLNSQNEVTLEQTGQLGLFGGPSVVLLTGGISAAQKRKAHESIASGSAQIVVGTHALIEEVVEFANLGMAVIDEQHRFGVNQRMNLREKTKGGVTPDVLIMTATPIPRTLALTLYGDLEVTTLSEMPVGRKPIRTRIIEGNVRDSAYELVRSEVSSGRQSYVITPLVDDSDKLEVKSAISEAKRLQEEVFPDLRVGLMHGRLGSVEKNRVMSAFRSGEIDVLISTTVVEVGVDVPNATVMLIEDADRFGLSQLHQLRGRIGRGEHASTCLLITSIAADEKERVVSRDRLEAMVRSSDGFELAQTDLQLRGAGSILGERQSGWFDLRLTNWQKDIDILKTARSEAFALIERDPELKGFPLIRKEMEGRFADRLEWLFKS